MSEDMKGLKANFCDIADRYEQRGAIQSASDLEAAFYATEGIKNIYKIKMLKDVDEGEYSERRYYYDDGMSYRRDSRGRYSRDDGGSYARGGRYGGRSYDDGYSGHSMQEHLDQMMAEAKTDRERDMIRRFKSELDR